MNLARGWHGMLISQEVEYSPSVFATCTVTGALQIESIV